MKNTNLISRALSILPAKTEKKLVLLVFVQVILGFLDLLGVAAIGFLGALIVNGVQSKAPGNRLESVLTFLNLSDSSFQSQAAVIGIFSAFILISKTLLSVILTKRTLKYLSGLASNVSKDLAAKLLERDILFIQRRSSHETYYLITYGVQALITGVLGTTISLIADSTLSVVIIIGLAVVNPFLASIVVVLFGGLAFFIFIRTQKKASDLGQADSELSILGQGVLDEALSSYREIYVMNRRSTYLTRYSTFRDQSANIQSELAFMPQVSKYIIETSIVVSGLVIAATAFLMQDALHAIATLSVFLAAGTRVAPAVLRIQQGAIHVKSSLGAAKLTLVLAAELNNQNNVKTPKNKAAGDFTPEVELINVSFKYPNVEQAAIDNISLRVKPGEIVALVGPSGAGKTTLADLILGVLKPELGEVFISMAPPQVTVSSWPGKVSYVPQETVIANSTIRANIGLGLDSSEISDAMLARVAKIAHLEDFISQLPDGFDTHVGENGARLSGGQRQRIGIARALFSEPELIVLDEATSALDGETESNISSAINELRGKVSLIIVAHRLSTVRAADSIYYLDQGKIVASGSFDELRLKVKDFDKQAKLMGL